MSNLVYLEEHNQYRKKLRDFLDDYVKPYVNEWEEAGIIPKEVWREMGKRKLLCPSVSEEYGGIGGDFLYSAILAEEIGRTNQWGLTANHHSDVSELYIEKYGSNEVKEKYLAKCVSGEIITGMAVTEPDAGSDIFGIKATAREVDGEIIINGSKTFISNAICADLFIIGAKELINGKKEDGFSLFLVPSDAVGFERGSRASKIGWKSQDTGELFLNNCRIPVSYRIGNVSEGVNIFFKNIQSERLILSITAITAAQYFVETILSTNKRELSQSEHFALVEMITEIKIGKNYINDLIKTYMSGDSIMNEICMAKCWSTELANKIASKCLDMYEHSSLAGNCPLNRGFRDSRIIKMTGGSNETLKAALVDLLGLAEKSIDISKVFPDENVNSVLSQDNTDLCNYWKKVLEGVTYSLKMGACKSNNVNKLSKYCKRKFYINKDLTENLNRLSDNNAESFENIMTMLLYTLVYRYTEQDTIVLGEFYKNNVLPLVFKSKKVDIYLLENAIKDISSTRKNAINFALPYSEIVECLDSNISKQELPEFILFYNREIDKSLTGYKIAIGIKNHNKELDVEIRYDSNLFEENSIIRMIGHLFTIITEMVRDSNCNIYQIPIITVNERHKILEQWNNNKSSLPNKYINNFVEQYAEDSPSSVAINYNGNEVSYEELNIKANKLAHYLIEMGITKEVSVGVCFKRSIEMIVAILAVWKAGGAHIPLDPDMPKERLEYIMNSSKTHFLLTERENIKKIDVSSEIKYLCIDQDSEMIDNESSLNPCIDMNQNNLAYIIYTSGTTGVPNGSQLEHKGLLNLALAQSEVFKVTRESRVLQFASITFDASVSEIAMAFCKGATLIMVDNESLTPGIPLSETINNYGVTHITITPSALAVQPYEEFPTLKSITVASENCTQEVANLWSKNRYFFNAYGPSECTVCATIKEFKDGEKLSIGKPITNVSVYILDSNEQVVPVGVPGEICIGGLGLGRGYINSKALNDKKFIKNPFNNGTHLFKTGDIGYWMPDGNIQFIGRKDYQVKIRGFRIELGEIEAVLSSNNEILTSIVVVREDIGNDKKIVAYVVKKENSELTSANLIEFMSYKLPYYMLPEYIVFLKEMPRNSSGKIDRKVLPKPSYMISESLSTYNEYEEKLLSIITEITGIQNININERITSLGVNSLVAVRIVTKIKDVFDINIPISKVFILSSIYNLANEIKHSVNSGKNNKLPSIKRRERV